MKKEFLHNFGKRDGGDFLIDFITVPLVFTQKKPKEPSLWQSSRPFGWWLGIIRGCR